MGTSYQTYKYTSANRIQTIGYNNQCAIANCRLRHSIPYIPIFILLYMVEFSLPLCVSNVFFTNTRQLQYLITDK